MTQTDTSTIKELALNTLSTIHAEEKRYHEANKVIHGIESDFPLHLCPMSGTCSKSVVILLDAILGDEIASYFLYEASNMRDGGAIQIGKVDYPIRTLADVRAFVYRDAS